MSFDKPPLPLFLFGALPAEDADFADSNPYEPRSLQQRGQNRVFDRPRIRRPRGCSLQHWRAYREALDELPRHEPGLARSRTEADRMISFLGLLDQN